MQEDAREVESIAAEEGLGLDNYDFGFRDEEELLETIEKYQIEEEALEQDLNDALGLQDKLKVVKLVNQLLSSLARSCSALQRLRLLKMLASIGNYNIQAMFQQYRDMLKSKQLCCNIVELDISVAYTNTIDSDVEDSEDVDKEDSRVLVELLYIYLIKLLKGCDSCSLEQYEQVVGL